MGEHSTHGQVREQLAGVGFLSFLHVGSEDRTRTQVIILRGKFLYLPSDLSVLIWGFYKVAKARTRKQNERNRLVKHQIAFLLRVKAEDFLSLKLRGFF